MVCDMCDVGETAYPLRALFFWLACYQLVGSSFAAIFLFFRNRVFFFFFGVGDLLEAVHMLLGLCAGLRTCCSDVR